MMKHLFIAILGLSLVISSASLLIAQQGGQEGTTAAKPAVPIEDPLMAAIFKEADVNGDGFITWPEAQKAGAEFKRDLYAQDVFERYDADHNGSLSRDEVSMYVKDSRGKKTTPGTTSGY